MLGAVVIGEGIYLQQLPGNLNEDHLLIKGYEKIFPRDIWHTEFSYVELLI
jgi:hypothetical protein